MLSRIRRNGHELPINNCSNLDAVLDDDIVETHIFVHSHNGDVFNDGWNFMLMTVNESLDTRKILIFELVDAFLLFESGQ